MKRRFFWLLPIWLLLLTACGIASWEQRTPQMQTVSLYFASAGNHSYAASSGALYAEPRELVAEDVTVSGLLQTYWSGPSSDNARQTLPQQLELLDWTLQDGLLALYVSDQWQSQTPLERSMAEAGLVMTMTQLADVQQLCVQTMQERTSHSAARICTPEDYLFQDKSAMEDEIAVRLYFPDAEGQYLEAETRYRAAEEPGNLEEFIVKQLLKGSERADRGSALPERTNLLGIELSQGACTVNFSEAFVTNAPRTHLQARLTVFSVVNSLTELPEVENVKLLCVGREITDYAGLDLSRPLVREELAIAPDAPAASDLKIQMCMPCCGSQLAALPMSVHQTAGRSGIDAVINALLSFEPANGYENPIPDGSALVNQTVQNGLCTVTFNNAFAQQGDQPGQQRLAVRTVVATLCSLPQIHRVLIQVSDPNLTFGYLGRELVPNDSWFLP